MCEECSEYHETVLHTDTCENCCEPRDKKGINLPWSCCNKLPFPLTGAVRVCGKHNTVTADTCLDCDHAKCDTCELAIGIDKQVETAGLENELPPEHEKLIADRAAKLAELGPRSLSETVIEGVLEELIDRVSLKASAVEDAIETVRDFQEGKVGEAEHGKPAHTGRPKGKHRKKNKKL